MRRKVTRERRPTYAVGHAGYRVRIPDGWRVLDVGSGHNPHPRADVLLELSTHDNHERGGGRVNLGDPRLVVGDALAMPFEDRAFDYVIASHLAEHVEDPAQLCREMQRVARAGYVETPGWLGDFVLREEYHRWRVRRVGRSRLRFTRVNSRQRLAAVAEAFYYVAYYGEPRAGHKTGPLKGRVADGIFTFARRVVGRLIRTPPLRAHFYTTLEWDGALTCEVDDGRSLLNCD